MDKIWTVEREEELKRLWADGWSAGRIAQEFGCFRHLLDAGRNAVVGKIHRMKLPPPLGKEISSRNKRQKQEPLPRGTAAPLVSSRGRIRNVTRLLAKANGHDPGLPPQRRNPSNYNILAKIAIAADAPGLSERLMGEAPDGTGIQVRDLTKHNCHWPKGDPKEAGFEFCGARAIPDLPYCARHCAIAYTPTQSRNRTDTAFST